MNTQKKPAHIKFTLIELLITISIIAILAGILLPALGAARRKAKGAACLGTLKQMGFSIVQYFDSYNETIITNHSAPSHTYGKMLERSGLVNPDTPAVYMCSEASRKKEEVGITTNGEMLNKRCYGINWQGIHSTNGVWETKYGETFGTAADNFLLRLSKIKKPSRFMLLVDTKMPGMAANHPKFNASNTTNTYSFPPWSVHAPLQSVNILRGDFGTSAAPFSWLRSNVKKDVLITFDDKPL